jgi:hypothetical protein
MDKMENGFSSTVQNNGNNSKTDYGTVTLLIENGKEHLIFLLYISRKVPLKDIDMYRMTRSVQ